MPMAAPSGARRQPLLLLLLGKGQGRSEGPRERRDYKGSGGCAVGPGGMGGYQDGVLGRGEAFEVGGRATGSAWSPRRLAGSQVVSARAKVRA